MNDEVEKKPDETPPATTDTSPPPKKAPPQQSPKRHNGRPLWILILLLLIGGGGFYAYTIYQKQANQFAALSEQQVQLRTQLQAQNDQLEQDLSLRLQAMQKQQDELATYLEVLRQQNKVLRKDWLILEAEYLMQMANHRLLFERDVNTAIAALRAADTRLQETGDPSVINVRKTLAESIQKLKQVPQADLAGLSITLSTVSKELDSLPLQTPDPQSRLAEQKDRTSEAGKVESWSQLPAAIWQDLKNLVIIRNHREPVQPLISPDQRFFLIENLRLQVEQARLAMLSGQGDVYRERLDTAIQWIQTHFNPDASHTQALLDTLRQLRAAAVAPDLPDISPLYKAMQQLRGGVSQDAPLHKDTGTHS